MLASTVQFSRNGPQPAPAPRQRGGREPARAEKTRPATRGAGSLRTQQRARTPRPRRPRSPPPAGGRVLDRQQQARQPNSQVLHKKTRAPASTRRPAAPARSLERR
jgi:hypothetical protein